MSLVNRRLYSENHTFEPQTHRSHDGTLPDKYVAIVNRSGAASSWRVTLELQLFLMQEDCISITAIATNRSLARSTPATSVVLEIGVRAVEAGLSAMVGRPVQVEIAAQP